MFNERTRGHRIVGACEQGRPREGRHFVIAGIAVAVVAAAVSAYAAYEQGQTQQSIARYNKKVAEREAQQRREAAAAAAKQRAKELEAQQSALRARIGGAGVVSSEGTPLLVQMDAAEQAALDVANVRYAGEIGAMGADSEAVISGYIGKRAARQGYIGAGASLLSGASSAMGAYGGGRSVGTSGGYSGGQAP